MLIVVPLPFEFDAIAKGLKSFGHNGVKTSVGPIQLLKFSDLGFQMAIGGHGKTQFGIQTQYLLNQFPKTRAVVCAGCAGGISTSVSIFDVVVANRTIEHDYRMSFVKKSLPEFSGEEKLLDFFRNYKPSSFGIHFGPIASGDEDITEKKRALEISQATGALAVAWEGAGGARASKFNKVPYLEIRGISDMADSPSLNDFSINLSKTMKHVAEALIQLARYK